MEHIHTEQKIYNRQIAQYSNYKKNNMSDIQYPTVLKIVKCTVAKKSHSIHQFKIALYRYSNQNVVTKNLPKYCPKIAQYTVPNLIYSNHFMIFLKIQTGQIWGRYNMRIGFLNHIPSKYGKIDQNNVNFSIILF